MGLFIPYEVPFDFENEFQFQYLGYGFGAQTVNPPHHACV